MKKNNFKEGVTLVEILISLSIIGFFVVTASTFEKDIFALNTNLQSNLNAQLDARHLVKIMIAELRKASASAEGSYAIDSASTTTMTFFSDVDSNGISDKVRYFLSSNSIKKGVIMPTGSPLVYNPANEVITTLINNAISSSTLPIFQYFPSTYAGTSSPLTYPIDISSIRLVKITVIIDSDPNRSPIPIIVTSSVSIRNLKDNL